MFEMVGMVRKSNILKKTIISKNIRKVNQFG